VRLTVANFSLQSSATPSSLAHRSQVSSLTVSANRAKADRKLPFDEQIAWRLLGLHLLDRKNKKAAG